MESTYERHARGGATRTVLFLLITLASAGCGAERPRDAAQDPQPIVHKGLQPESFSSYSEAIAWVRANPSLRRDAISTARSSWIEGSEYYSNGSGYGYLILNLKGREYIHENIPEEEWQRFKDAASLGQYYNRHIRGRYGFRLGVRTTE